MDALKTYVIYMALKHIAEIRSRLLNAGRMSGEPVAIVSKATLRDERVLETTLENCVNDLTENKIDPPAIVVVGDVVYLRDGLDWVGALSGRILSVYPLKTRVSRNVG